MQRTRFVLSTSCQILELNHLQPRKYNGVLRRHGIKIEGGEVITLDSIAEDINDIDGKEPKTPDTAAKIASKTPNSKMPKTPASKKRKAKAKKEEEEEPETPTIKTELNEVDKLLLEERSEDEAE